MPSFTAPALKRDLPGIALVTISRLQTLCENMLPRYSDKVRFLPLRQGFHAAVAALQASIDAGAVDVVLAAGSNGAYLRDHLSVPVVTVKVNGFDVLDATKIIPEKMVPVEAVGRMVLDRNPDNFFAETEQVAFCTAHVIPGIDFSNDPLLQGRIHSYVDTQITRLA